MIQQDIHQINAIQNHCIRDFGGKIIKLGTFIKASVALEGVVCGMILGVAKVYGVDPITLTNVVTEGVQTRMKEVVEKP